MKLFSGFTCKDKLMSRTGFIENLKADTQKGIETLSQHEKHSIISEAEAALQNEIPILLASVYKQFAITGNRSEYQDPYFLRRSMLLELTLGELCENKGRFLEKIVDLVWAILEESTWVVPAHNKGKSALLYEFDDVEYIDLFSCSTAANLALTYAFFQEALDDGDKEHLVSRRLETEIERRIFTPFEKYAKGWFYIGYYQKKLNNWNPWVLSNLLFITAIFEEHEERRISLCDDMLTYTDNFLDTYGSDGGCDEGPSYWGAAGAAYFDFLDLLYKLSDGKINKFEEPLVYNMGDYIRKASIGDGYFVNFADCAPIIKGMDVKMIYRFGKSTNNMSLMAFACSLDNENIKMYHHPQRALYSIIEPMDCTDIQPYKPNEAEILQDTQVFIFRNDRYFIAIKGGNNRESHNHNDVGHFMLFEDNKPVIIDAGADTYSKVTFSDDRYTLWYMNSSYHNLPDIGAYRQLAGADYKAQDVHYDEVAKTVTMQLKSAYPKEAGIHSFIRRFIIEKSGLVIEDNIVLSKENIIEGHLMLFEEPQICKDTIYVHDTQIVIENVEEITSEQICILNTCGLNSGVPERGNMAKAWGKDCLYRIKANVKAKEVVMRYVIGGRH